ncbi:MAG TPA: hypothetical protein VNU45_17865 [Rummeliibacillus sp.]|nr:hypothetical protein [Rummeliibacillus sp.]
MTVDKNINRYPSYLANPPIYDKLLDENGMLTTNWQNWFNSITQIMGFGITHDSIKDSSVGRKDASILACPAYSTADRDNLDNARQGTVIFNTDYSGTPSGPQFQFQITDTSAGSSPTWVTFTPVAVP